MILLPRVQHGPADALASVEREQYAELGESDSTNPMSRAAAWMGKRGRADPNHRPKRKKNSSAVMAMAWWYSEQKASPRPP